MSLYSVFYEFEVNRENIEFLIRDLGITQKNAPAVRDVAENLIEMMNNSKNIYAKVEISDKPGLMLKFSRRLQSERLPYPIGGIHAVVPSGSEGHLGLEEFKAYFERALSFHGIIYKKYE